VCGGVSDRVFGALTIFMGVLTVFACGNSDRLCGRTVHLCGGSGVYYFEHERCETVKQCLCIVTFLVKLSSAASICNHTFFNLHKHFSTMFCITTKK